MKGYQSESRLTANLAGADHTLISNCDDPQQLLAQYLQLSQVCDRQSSRIEKLETMLQFSQHQWRHLLSLITLYAENLRLGLRDHPLEEQAEILQQTTFQLQQHLNQLVTEKPWSLNVRVADLRTIFQASIKDLSLIIKAKQLIIKYPENKALAMVDSWQIKQVFDNLLHNAIYFAPQTSNITCRWQVFQQEMLVEISDCGCGFSPTALQQALHPDYSTREDGTGLGLAIANQIIQEHQGRLWVDNLSGGGAIVSFILPRKLN